MAVISMDLLNIRPSWRMSEIIPPLTEIRNTENDFGKTSKSLQNNDCYKRKLQGQIKDITDFPLFILL